MTARHAPAALRIAYLLTGDRARTVDITRLALIEFLSSPRRREVDDVDRDLLRRIARLWRESGGSEPSPDDASSPPIHEPTARRIQTELAAFDDHQRAVIALHVFGGLPVEDLADVLDIASEVAYVQMAGSRDRLVQAAGLEGPGNLPAALNAVAISAPRMALWPEIETDVQRRIEAEETRQRRLSIGIAGGLIATLALGIVLIVVRGGDDPSPAAPTEPVLAALPPGVGTPYTGPPTATPTPSANVGDTLVFSSRSAETSRTWRFDQRLDEAPLLGEDTFEAYPPVVAPDGQQVFLLWYAFENGAATGYLAAFDSNLASELWRMVVMVDEEVEIDERTDFRMALAADHERVYVARHAWTGSELVEIDVLSREDGALQETITTNLSGFAAHDIRLHAPPGSNQVSLMAITTEAPPETGALQITFLAYEIPGGERVHGRILFDRSDSRTFFLYDSQLIAGSELLFGVEQTHHYRQLAVHFFDLNRGRLEPRRVIPFQQVADPLPYQKAVSHDGHWLYVLSPAGLEVAVFNLRERTLAGIVPLDPGVLRDREIGVSYPQSRSMHISPDGGRIYAEGTLDGRPSGIWVIDTDSWTIVDHWLPDRRPGEILLSGDGETLYTRVQATQDDPSDAASLLAIDTVTGEAAPVEIPDADRYSLASLATLYQRTYGSSPAIDGRRLESNVSTEPLAAAVIDIAPSRLTQDSAVAIDVRFVHPVTGDPVAQESGGARFEPPDSVRATWTPEEEGASLILELGNVDYGHYQGFVQLDQPGYWSLRIDVDWPGDSTFSDRTSIQSRAVQVVPPVTADGDPGDESPSG